MSFSSNFTGKSSILKPVIIILAILLVIGGAYSFFGKKDSDSESKDAAQINSSGLDADQRIKNVGDVEEVLAKWVEANPQAILNSVANMQKKMMEEQVQNAQKNIGSKKSQLFDSKSPSYKPKGYDVTIVEFYDYNCGYCKRANGTLEEFLKSDKKVRVIYKDFPILGQASEELSKVSIAVDMVDSSAFKRFHDKLMSSNAATKEDALALAKEVGIDVKKLENTLASKKDKIMEIIQANRLLGSEIGIQGTPAFVIGEELIPGAVDAAILKEKVKALR